VFPPTETKYQGWRAVAVLRDGTERLLYVGRSAPHVQAGYAAAFLAVLDEDEQEGVLAISLQCWRGAADRGAWVTKLGLPLPGQTPAPEPRPRLRSRPGAPNPSAFSLN
jgi:hypothetical protein